MRHRPWKGPMMGFRWRSTHPTSPGRTPIKIALIVILCVVLAPVLLGAVCVAANWAPEIPVEDLRARWAPPPSVFLDVAGMTVHLRDEGPRDDDSPIVLLHGTGSSLHAWDDWTN